VGDVRCTLRLRYEGADAELPVAFSTLSKVRASFEAGHARLFGFVEPERQIVIAAAEVETVALSSPLRDGGGGAENRGPAQSLPAAPGHGNEVIQMFARGAWLPA
ncbi:MAG: hypothetical protein ACK56I_15195, partial [bacterium]